MSKKIDQSIKKIVRRYLTELKKELPIDYGLIFGSYAKGRVHRGSDIDVCIVSPVFRGKKGFELETIL